MPLTEVSPVVLETAVDNRIELETAGVVVRFGSSFDEGHLLRVLEVLEGRR